MVHGDPIVADSVTGLYSALTCEAADFAWLFSFVVLIRDPALPWERRPHCPTFGGPHWVSVLRGQLAAKTIKLPDVKEYILRASAAAPPSKVMACATSHRSQ
jgi:hypothetical protein